MKNKIMFEQLIPLTDSRSLTDAPRTVFFALRTPTGDGHRFIPELYRRGVRNFVIDREAGDVTEFSSRFQGANFLQVDSPLQTLQQLAADRRAVFDGKVIGVTGSRGKTMVKEWLGNALAPSWRICRSPRSYNSQIGVPLSVWNLSKSDNLGIFEAGISRRGEMSSIASIISPDIAVITNIDDDHDEGFDSRDEKISEKLLLAAKASTLIYPADSPSLPETAHRLYPDKRHLSWSINGNDPDAPLQVAVTPVDGDSRLLTYIYYKPDGETISGEVTLPPLGHHWQIENAVTLLTVMLALDTPQAEINSRLESLIPAGTRMQVSGGVNGSLIIHDDYTCDLSSLSQALDFTHRRLTAGRRLTVILSDIAADRGEAEEMYRQAARELHIHDVTRVIGIGEEITRYFPLLETDGKCYRDTEEFLRETDTSEFDSQVILVKGSPRFGFETIVNHLEAKTHETILEVNLDAMVDNFNFFRSRLRPETGLIAMVKASGYGAGSLEPAKTLQAHGAAYLAVAVGDEGAELRRAGITMPIMVLNPMVLNYKQLFDNNLEPEIFSFESLNEIITEACKAGVTSFPIHIKLDTGMHRLGFREEEIPRLLDILDNQQQVTVRSVFSHLATADCPDMDDYTLAQLEYFTRCSSLITDHFPYRVLRHVLNTAGILRFPEYQFDMARLGIGLYGISILNDGSEDRLRPISSMRSVVIALRKWDKTETVGYGRRGVLTRDSLIATVPVGYADGFNRQCSRGKWHVSVNGHLCPTVGNICMDTCMIDVTDVPDVRIGDPVVIFGPGNPVTEMARMLDTIPYECLTSVSPRVRRVYYRES